MPSIASIAKIEFPYKISQQELKEHIKEMISFNSTQEETIINIFDNTGINSRNLCKPIDYYKTTRPLQEYNNDYINLGIEYSSKAIEESIALAKIKKNDITDFIFVSSEGITFPSLDALLIKKLRLKETINRTPIVGLGCSGGVSGIAKANLIAKANPNAVVLLVTLELCSLMFLRNNFNRDNLIASSLFSDGIAACIIKGDNHESDYPVNIVSAQSKLYYDSLDLIGLNLSETGVNAFFSENLVSIIRQHTKKDITNFLAQQHIKLNDIKNYIFHSGEIKVLETFTSIFNEHVDSLKKTSEIFYEYGNLSSASVLYVLEKFMREGFENGYGLMLAIGPGFSAEMVLLTMVTD